MGTNCAPLLADLFLYAYEAYFLQGLFKNKDRKLEHTSTLNYSFLLWMMFCRWTFLDSVIIYLHRIYPNELKVKDTTDTQKYAFYLDNGKRWNIKLLNKRNDTFPIVHFPFISSNITTSSAYWVSKVILEVVPSTVIFCTDLSCWRRSYSHNIFDRTHCNK